MAKSRWFVVSSSGTGQFGADESIEVFRDPIVAWRPGCTVWEVVLPKSVKIPAECDSFGVLKANFKRQLSAKDLEEFHIYGDGSEYIYISDVERAVFYGDAWARVTCVDYVWAYGNARVDAYGENRVYAYDNSHIESFSSPNTVYAMDESTVLAAAGEVVALEEAEVEATGDARVWVRGNAFCRASGRVIVTTSDFNRVKLSESATEIVMIWGKVVARKSDSFWSKVAYKIDAWKNRNRREQEAPWAILRSQKRQQTTLQQDHEQSS